MRILFVTGEYPVMQGGVGDYTRRIGQALGRLGAEVHVLTQRSAGNDDQRPPAEPGEPTVHPILTGTGWGLWGQVMAYIRKRSPDVVHVQYQSAAYGLHPAINTLPWRLRQGRYPAGQPFIATTFHDLRVPYIFPKAGPLRWPSVLALARYSDASVMTNAADWARVAAADPSLRSRLFAIPIGSNIYREPPTGFDRDRQRARWGTGPGDWLLAYFGFLNANKGGETLVAALSELVAAGQPAHLLMVGGQVGASDPTNAAYLEHVKATIARLGLSDRVHWTGFTAAAQVSANLLAADCAVLPYREGASLRHGSLMAALAHGLPIVTTIAAAGDTMAGPAADWLRTTGDLYPKLVDGANALLVPPDDPGQLAAAVTRVMAAPDLRSRLAEGALDLARAFNWDTIARQHLEMYSRLENAIR